MSHRDNEFSPSTAELCPYDLGRRWARRANPPIEYSRGDEEVEVEELPPRFGVLGDVLQIRQDVHHRAQAGQLSRSERVVNVRVPESRSEQGAAVGDFYGYLVVPGDNQLSRYWLAVHDTMANICTHRDGGAAGLDDHCELIPA